MSVFLHTDLIISKVLEQHIINDLRNFRPILLYGHKGIGKYTYLKAFVRSFTDCARWEPFSYLDKDQTFERTPSYEQDCDCFSCNKIVSGKASDVCVLSKEGIGEFKKKVQNFINHNPVELSYRWLILLNLNQYSRDTLNTFLKILEEPYPYLKILATAITLEGVPKAIISRFHTMQVNPLNKLELEQIVKRTPTLVHYKALLNKYQFDSVFKLIIYHKYLFEETFTRFFVNPSNIISLEKEIVDFLESIKRDSKYDFNEILAFFLQFFIDRVHEFCDINDTVSLKVFKSYFSRVIKNYSQTLFKYLNSNINYFYMNVEVQFKLFIFSVYQLKVISSA